MKKPWQWLSECKLNKFTEESAPNGVGDALHVTCRRVILHPGAVSSALVGGGSVKVIRIYGSSACLVGFIEMTVIKQVDVNRFYVG